MLVFKAVFKLSNKIFLHSGSSVFKFWVLLSESQPQQNDLNNDNRMRFESQRLATFISWPATAKVGASKIAKAGFYYTGSYLEVKCKWCGCCIASWEFGDQVMMRHRTAKPDCQFILNVSDNVPLAPSPHITPQITPQTSQVDSSQSTVETTGTT